jgi:hypothetical protein
MERGRELLNTYPFVVAVIPQYAFSIGAYKYAIPLRNYAEKYI